jgi:hypothetical protein
MAVAALVLYIVCFTTAFGIRTGAAAGDSGLSGVCPASPGSAP